VLGLSRTPGHLIRRAQQVHTASWTQRLHGELTGPQYAALVAAATEPGIDQSRLAELASLDKNTAAGVIRRLVAQGWIQRAADPADGRRHPLRLTAPARAALRYLTPAAALVQEDLLQPVDAGRRDTFIDLLARMAQVAAIPRLAGPGAGAPVAEISVAEVPVLPMARTPGYLIRRAQARHASIWGDVVGSELTGPQYAVLAALALQPGADQATIGRLASLDSSSTADIVGRLDRGGWLRRALPSGGGRRVSWHLSPAAADRLERITPRAEQVQAEFLGPLDPPEASCFTDDLALIAYRGAPPGTG
jgi:MarR family transcriptional regulator, lower aerobic nicotinate degradation pathway regulator